MGKVDLYQTVTDRVIEAMESGAMPWQKGWENCGSAGMIPLRHNGEMYRGINVLLLWIAAESRGFESAYWMTYKQAQSYGANVRKGEKGTPVVYYNVFAKECEKTGKEKKIPFLKNFTVFNADQIDVLPESFTQKPNPVDNGTRSIQAFESFFTATGAKIVTKGNRACYIPSIDEINMPKIEQFVSAESYYGTLAHELIHWTGHGSRLDRALSMEKESYAFEELIAEMGALYISSYIGVTPDFENSAAYLQSWIRALRNDKKFIFKAATAAQKATDLALELGDNVKKEIAA